jgi:hypothetical protein
MEKEEALTSAQLEAQFEELVTELMRELVVLSQSQVANTEDAKRSRARVDVRSVAAKMLYDLSVAELYESSTYTSEFTSSKMIKVISAFRVAGHWDEVHAEATVERLRQVVRSYTQQRTVGYVLHHASALRSVFKRMEGYHSEASPLVSVALSKMNPDAVIDRAAMARVTNMLCTIQRQHVTSSGAQRRAHSNYPGDRAVLADKDNLDGKRTEELLTELVESGQLSVFRAVSIHATLRHRYSYSLLTIPSTLRGRTKIAELLCYVIDGNSYVFFNKDEDIKSLVDYEMEDTMPVSLLYSMIVKLVPPGKMVKKDELLHGENGWRTSTPVVLLQDPNPWGVFRD